MQLLLHRKQSSLSLGVGGVCGLAYGLLDKRLAADSFIYLCICKFTNLCAQEAMVAHGHAKAEAQHAEQLARTLVDFRPPEQPAGSSAPAANQPVDPSRPGYASLPQLTYNDFEHIWMSAALTGPSLARH